MAVSTSSLSLATWAKQSNAPLIERVTKSLYELDNIAQDVPFISRKTMEVTGSRFVGSLPAINWGQINLTPAVTTGEPTQYRESAWIIRNFIDVDEILRDDVNSIGDPMAQQIMSYMAALTFDVNTKFINNDHITGNSQAIVGLKWRLNNPTSLGGFATIPSGSSAGTAQNLISSGQDLRLVNITSKTANAFLENVGQLLRQMKAPDGNGVVLYMNGYMYDRFTTSVRTAGSGAGWDTTLDDYGRVAVTFRGAILRDIGRQSDQWTQIITETENSDGTDTSSSTYTSIYGVKWGSETALGWQWEPFAAWPAFKTDDAVIDRTFLKWYWGLVFPDTYSVGRVYDINING